MPIHPLKSPAQEVIMGPRPDGNRSLIAGNTVDSGLDLIGAAVCVLGVTVIMYAPRA